MGSLESSEFLRQAILASKGKKFQTISELAEKAGVNQGNLSSFMKPQPGPGRRESMNFESAWKILNFLGCLEQLTDQREAQMENRWEKTAKAAWDAILAKVKELNGSGLNLQEIADKVGVSNRSIISGWINGERKAENASFADLMSYLERLELDYDVFLPPRQQIKRIEPNAPLEDAETDDATPIPVYLVAGAGPGVLPTELEPLFTVKAPPAYFWSSDYAVVVDGHSMEPLIPHGAVVGIKSDFNFIANELYLAQLPYEGNIIKRVGVDRKTEEYIFKSQNPDKDAYPDFRISVHEAENIIIGRVVWVMIRC